MRDNLAAIITAVLFALAFGLMALVRCSSEPSQLPPPAKPTPLIEVKQAEELDEGYLLRLMDACGAKLSEASRKVRASQMMTVGNQMIPDPIHRRWFYYVVCIESRFEQGARSHAGATGLTQVMPKYAQEFADKCGLGKLGPKDLEDSHVNLTVGACQFRSLMEYYGGDPTLALAAYNSGTDSPTVKKTKVGDVRTGHPETQGYLAAAFVLDTKMRKEDSNAN